MSAKKRVRATKVNDTVSAAQLDTFKSALVCCLSDVTVGCVRACRLLRFLEQHNAPGPAFEARGGAGVLSKMRELSTSLVDEVHAFRNSLVCSGLPRVVRVLFSYTRPRLRCAASILAPLYESDALLGNENPYMDARKMYNEADFSFAIEMQALLDSGCSIPAKVHSLLDDAGHRVELARQAAHLLLQFRLPRSIVLSFQRALRTSTDCIALARHVLHAYSPL
jgi:hypothetical protein